MEQLELTIDRGFEPKLSNVIAVNHDTPTPSERLRRELQLPDIGRPVAAPQLKRAALWRSTSLTLPEVPVLLVMTDQYASVATNGTWLYGFAPPEVRDMTPEDADEVGANVAVFQADNAMIALRALEQMVQR